MVMRKKTLRRLSPVARKVARLAGEADSLGRRLKNMVQELQQLELDAAALKNAKGGKYNVQIDIPDGAFCNSDHGNYCPVWWMNEDGEEGCIILGEMRKVADGENTFECEKFPGCPNPARQLEGVANG